MPLFFFISGYLFKPNFNLKKYFVKKTLCLLVPYVVFLLLLGLLFTPHSKISLDAFIETTANFILGGRQLQGPLGVFWFITCLYLTQQIMNLVLVKFRGKSLVFIMAGFLFLSYVNSISFSTFWLPWNANVIFAAAPIFFLGYLYKKWQPNFNMTLISTLGVLIIIASFWFPNNTYDMKSASYGIPIVTLLSALILIIGLKFLSILLSKNRFFKIIFSELGKASLTIMYVHLPIIYVIDSFYKLNKLTVLLLAIYLPYLMYSVFEKSKLTRGLLLGKPKALSKLFNVSMINDLPEKAIEVRATD
jgi:fucose 4-O-acetylase-like acetyltransferase